MLDVFPPLQFLLVVFAGWVHRQQLDVIDYLKEENRVLRERLGDRRSNVVALPDGVIQHRDRLGGMLKYYYGEAA